MMVIGKGGLLKKMVDEPPEHSTLSQNESTSTQTTSEEPKQKKPPSSKSTTAAMLLCFFLGVFGAHQFYTGKIIMGIVYFIGVFIRSEFLFAVAIIDMFRLAYGIFPDATGAKLEASFAGKIFCWVILVVLAIFLSADII